jgi:hypothetical protein
MVDGDRSERGLAQKLISDSAKAMARIACRSSRFGLASGGFDRSPVDQAVALLTDVTTVAVRADIRRASAGCSRSSIDFFQAPRKVPRRFFIDGCRLACG